MLSPSGARSGTPGRQKAIQEWMSEREKGPATLSVLYGSVVSKE